MKKIYLALVAVLLTALLPLGVMAETPQLTATNEEGEVKVNITNSMTTQAADILLPGIFESKTPITKELTLKAEAGVIASLRLEISEPPTTGKETPLNNFVVVVSDTDGNVIYNTESKNQAKRNDDYKEIKLGELQANEEKTYTITYSVADETVDISKISVTLAAKTNVRATPAPTLPESTPAPKFDFNSLENKSEFVFDFADEFTDTTSGEPGTTKEIKKICGKDIPAGRFLVTGNGGLKITSANGGVKETLVISENPVSGKSVKQQVVILAEGDVLTIVPLDGDEKARLKFNKITTETATNTAAPVSTIAPVKANPKTGDNGIGIAIGVAVLAVLAFAGLEVLKHKGNN